MYAFVVETLFATSNTAQLVFTQYSVVKQRMSQSVIVK
jgi:hypothetical protein